MAEPTSKHLYVWRPAAGTSIASFASFAKADLAEALAGCGADDVSLHLTEAAPPRITPVPYKAEPLALVGVRGTEAALKAATERLLRLPGRLEAWRVDESIPVPRPRSWALGERAPGSCLLTFFKQHPGLSRNQFFHEWYERHTPLSLEIHPLAGYVRNAVVEPLLPGTPHWDGIVTESFAAVEDLTSTRRLFGGTLRCVPNMIRVGLHVSRFLELSTIENAFVAEYALDVGPRASRSAAPVSPAVP